MALTQSKPASIFTPEGNSLAVFIDVNDGELKLKDVFGGVELFSDFISGGGGGGLNLKDDVVISATLTEVVDKDNTPSVLRLSTQDVTNYGGGAITNNTAFGQGSLINNTTGFANTAFGSGALENNTTGNTLVAIGFNALNDNTTGQNSVAIGNNALGNNISGLNNVAIGTTALGSNTTAEGNVAIGQASLIVNTTGQYNTAVGRASLSDNIVGNNNVAVGHQSLSDNKASNNTAVGFQALNEINSGSNNTAIGYNTGIGIISGSNNTILGANVTGLSATLENNIIIADGSGNQRINVDSTGTINFKGNKFVNFVPSIPTTAVGLTIDSANQDTFCASVLEVTGAVTITFASTIREGFSTTIIQQDANQCVIEAGAGLTLRNNNNHTASAGQFAVINIIRIGTNLFLSGETGTNPVTFGKAYLFIEQRVDNDPAGSAIMATILSSPPFNNANFFGFHFGSTTSPFPNGDVDNYVKLDWGGAFPSVVEIPIPSQSGGFDSSGAGLVKYLMQSLEIAQGTYSRGIYSFFIPTADTGDLIMKAMFVHNTAPLGDFGTSLAPSVNPVGGFTNNIFTASGTGGSKIPAGTYRIYNDYSLATGGAVNFDKDNAVQPLYFRGQNIF
jgi:hypothetical protein